MLPEFLFTVGNSMQDISRDDFSLLSGATSCEKDMCPTVQRINPSPLPITSIGKATAASENINNNFEQSPLIGIKLEDTSSPIDLFPTHPTTWQQHPMNNHDLAHHRLQHHNHPHHRLDSTCKLLLQGSDDPFICHGANNVNNDDDHPAEFKTLIAAVANGRQQIQQQQQHHHQQQHQHQPHQQQQHQQQHSNVPKPYMPPSQPTLSKRPQNGCSSLTKQQLKVKANLMSAQNQSQASAVPTPPPTPKTRTPKPKKKGALKLRFHHQALPPEYLSHYEATQGQHIARPQPPAKESQAKEAQTVKLSQTVKLPPPKSAHENVRSWLQKIAEIQRSAQQQQPAIQAQSVHAPHDANNNHQVSRMEVASPISAPSPIATIVQDHRLALASPKTQSMGSQSELKTHESPSKSLHLPGPTKRVINYSDLPYMGEITLDNSKPRRGRKPKKADICHLIYKNYGTIFPGTPKNTFTTQTPGSIVTKLKSALNGSVEEPLNLCLRDQSSDLYSVSSGEDDEPEEASESTSNCPTPVATPSDAATDTLLATNMRVSMPGLEEPAGSLLEDPQLLTKNELDTKIVSTSVSPMPTVGASNPINLQSHPMNMYYQKLLESGALIQQNGHVFGLPIETIQKDNQLALKIPIPSGLFLTPKLEKISPIPLINTMDYPEPMSTPSSIKSENSTATTTSCATTPQQQQLPPQKRKRSAIFIPPMPAENTTNPATEVSICKFKFTGGAKPTLQEKKMLSVDSDGNYRYYSGTGDKSMRGYEFFPRETLQQSGLLPGVNCAGAFLNATGEKISIDIPPPSAGLSNELLQIPDSPTTSMLLPPASSVLSSTNSPQTAHSPFSISPNLLPQATSNSTGVSLNTQNASTARPLNGGSHSAAANTSSVSASQRILERKKKPRRSTQREKLEKTFKEKGFLIQTQQLESAEGATYCKFRQLKKFTRYLFRNWKDYLPDELQQANAAAAAAAAAVALHKNGSGEAATEAANTASHQAAIESILASHGFGSDGQRLLKSNPQVIGGANVTVDNTS